MQTLQKTSGPASSAQLQLATCTFCGDCLVWEVHSRNYQCHITSCKARSQCVGSIKKPSELLMASLGAPQYKCTNGSSTTTVALQSLCTHLSFCTGVYTGKSIVIPTSCQCVYGLSVASYANFMQYIIIA